MSQIVLVTGASRGIGREAALLAASRGWDVVVNFVANHTAAEEVAGGVRATGRRVMTIRADVSKVDQVEAMFDAIDDELGTLDALVNNAGIGETQARGKLPMSFIG